MEGYSGNIATQHLKRELEAHGAFLAADNPILVGDVRRPGSYSMNLEIPETGFFAPYYEEGRMLALSDGDAEIIPEPVKAVLRKYSVVNSDLESF